ncbi:MAG: hypothetical protein PWQ17_941 [Anaerophaga sp.]|nr:hypothetical protein [Anaerophaga sp.]MDN5290595.1 hypothetical protein [Anaerophaga sp.]
MCGIPENRFIFWAIFQSLAKPVLGGNAPFYPFVLNLVMLVSLYEYRFCSVGHIISNPMKVEETIFKSSKSVRYM